MIGKFEIIPSFKCNYKCLYCTYNEDKQKHNAEMLPDQYENICRNLNKLTKPYMIWLTGGEPFIYTYVLEFIQYFMINANLVKPSGFRILTNGSMLSFNFIRKYIHIFDDDLFFFNITLHGKNVDNIYTFMKNIDWLRKYRCHVYCTNLFDDTEQYHNNMLFLKYAKLSKLHFKNKCINGMPHELQRKYRDIFLKYDDFLKTNSIIYNGNNKYKNRLCNNYGYLWIFPDGEMKTCMEDIDTNINFITKEYDSNFMNNMIETKNICIKNICHFPALITLQKDDTA